MSSVFEIGDTVPLTWTVAVAGTPTNATVVLTVTAPDGTTSTPTVSNPSTGSYAATYTPTLNGTHNARWVATGAVTAAETVAFDVGSNYTTLTVLKASLGISDTDDDLALMRAIRGASRRIDYLTGTHFFTVTEARTFSPECSGELWIDRLTDLTGMVVKTGTNGTYSTTVAAADVVAWPYSAPRKGDAYCRLLFPTYALPVGYVRPTVQVTASWGWSFIPQPVEDACVLMAARGYRRKDSPEGIAGSSEFGVVRVSKFDDPDAMLNLQPYCLFMVA